MRAVRNTDDGIRVVDAPDPSPDAAADLVVVDIASVSICGSDFGYMQAGSRLILGHELGGTTPDGAPVAIEAVFGCGRCDQCRGGTYNRCRTVGERVPGLSIDGGMADLMAVPPSSVVPLPPGLDVRNASLVEPAGVAWHAVRVGSIGPDVEVAIVGGGAIGLLVAAAARSIGASVALAARYPHQVEAGERLGAVPIGVNEREYDVVVEAAGTPSALARAVELVRPGGTVVYTGVFGSEVLPLPFLPAFLKEAVAVPSMAYCRHDGGRDVEHAAAMLAAQPEIVDILVTHRFPLEDAPEAFRVAADRSAGAIKVIVEP